MHLYNSLTRTKSEFKPLVPGKIAMYVCGITVYDYCHLGHARAMVLFDIMLRYFRSQNYEVTFVRNITDIDDKIIHRAHERGLSIEALTSQYIEAMHRDTDRLNILRPDIEPRATEHIPAIIDLIDRLMTQGFAYVSDNGDVCFEVSKFKDYGKLSQQDLDALQAGSRVDVVKEKRSPLDFVLWKLAKEGEPFWSSPWGEGRPGWHIECSAMSMHALGEQFDIHGGGCDLQFPHHENEIAQSEAVTGKQLANYWLHIGMLQVNNEKMAKSVGNFFTIHDVIATHKPEVVRFFLMSSHYRSDLNYSEEQLLIASKSLGRLYQTLLTVPVDDGATEIHKDWLARFNVAMDDDFNTPVALAVLFELAHEVNKTQDKKLAKTLKMLGNILGLLESAPAEFFKSDFSAEKIDEIEMLIAARNQARQAKDWVKSDEIRAQLMSQGIALKDADSKTSWYKIES